MHRPARIPRNQSCTCDHVGSRHRALDGACRVPDCPCRRFTRPSARVVTAPPAVGRSAPVHRLPFEDAA